MTSSGLHKDVSTRWNSTLEMLASLLKNKGKLSMLRHVKFIYPNLNIGKIVNLSFYKQLYPKHFLSVVYFLNIFLFKYNLNVIIIYFVEVVIRFRNE